MSTRQIASSTLWQIASQAVMALLSVVTVKFVAIALSKELAGNYNSVYSFLQIFGILADFGLYAVAVREVARAKEKEKVMGALIILRAIILCISLGAALLIVWIVPAWRGTPLPIGVSIAALVPFFTLLAGIQRTVFQVTYKMHFVFIAEVLQRVLTVMLIAAVVLRGTRDSQEMAIYNYLLFAGGAGALLLFALSTYFARRLMKIRLAWDRELITSLLKQAAPYGLAFLCTALYRQMDVTLIALLRFDYDVQNAHYGFALRATEMAYLIPTFLLNSTLPVLSERDANGEDTRGIVGKTFFIILLLGSTAALFASIWARPLMQLLTTDAYLSNGDIPGSDTALLLLSIPMFLNGIVLFCFYSLLTKNAWKPLTVTLGLGALFSLCLNVMFIPRFGFVGSCWASIATHLFLTCALLPQALKMLPMQLTIAQMKQWLLYAILLGGVLFLFRDYLLNEWITILAVILAALWMGTIAWGMGITKALRG
jgi:O-antigen/teichoic acid export membrane protein